jgi:hypothetical protein
MRSGRLFAQATWAPHTGENESSSWPTPCARDEKGAYTNHRQGGKDLSSEIQRWPTPIASDANGPRAEDGKRSTGLNTRVLERTEWPTPTAVGFGASNQRAGKKRHAQDSAVTLPEAVRHWPTPQAGDGKSAGSRNLPGSAAHAGVSLTDAVIHGGSSTPREWPTPCATPYGRQKTGTEGAALRPSLETHVKKTGMQLNADWVETLMGCPLGWTAGPPVPAKSKKTGSRRARSRAKPIRTDAND